jgi:hypothetical protein
MAIPTSDEVRSDIRAILQLLLDASELSRYYHFDAMPERLPLKLVNRTSLDLGRPDVKVEGQAVVVSTEPDGQSIELRAFAVIGDSAEIAFEYPADGLVGKGLFRETHGGWSLDRLTIAER